MIPPKINIKTTVSDTEVPKYNKLTKQLLMASCTGDLKGAVSKAECNTVNESTLGHYHSAPALLA